MKEKIIEILNEYAIKYASLNHDIRPLEAKIILEEDFPAIAEKIEALDNWVSVETPPEESGWYQCAKASGVYVVAHYFDSDTGLFTDYDSPKADPLVTHWQPLPSKPKNN